MVKKLLRSNFWCFFELWFILNFVLIFYQSQNPSTSTAADGGDSRLMRALDPEDRKQFKKISSEESILKLAGARNRMREEYNESLRLWPIKGMSARLDDKRKQIQEFAQQIADLKKQKQKNLNWNMFLYWIL